MIGVRKSDEPEALRRARVDRASWNDGFAGKSEVRRTLIADQAGICSSCERDLADRGEVEHFHPRSIDVCHVGTNTADDDSWGLTWSNLFVSCAHHAGVRSCNAVKRDRDLCDLVLHPSSERRPAAASGFTVDTTTGELSSTHPLESATIYELRTAVGSILGVDPHRILDQVDPRPKD